MDPMNGIPREIQTFAFPEYLKISSLWASVIDECGAQTKVRPLPAPPWVMDNYNMAAAVVSNDETGEEFQALGYGIGITTMFSDAELKAIMAHELGHMVNGDLDNHIKSRESEIAADFYAATHGYASILAETLQKIGKEANISDELSGSDGIHPPTSYRVKYLMAFAEQRAA